MPSAQWVRPEVEIFMQTTIVTPDGSARLGGFGLAPLLEIEGGRSGRFALGSLPVGGGAHTASSHVDGHGDAVEYEEAASQVADALRGWRQQLQEPLARQEELRISAAGARASVPVSQISGRGQFARCSITPLLRVGPHVPAAEQQHADFGGVLRVCRPLPTHLGPYR